MNLRANRNKELINKANNLMTELKDLPFREEIKLSQKSNRPSELIEAYGTESSNFEERQDRRKLRKNKSSSKKDDTRIKRTEKLDPQADLEAENDLRNSTNRRTVFFQALQDLNPLNTVNLSRNKRAETKENRQAEIEKSFLRNITVVAFVGPSGTGKSTKASKVAQSRNIKYIIDDGLLIEDGHIIAGSTAKRASTMLEAVRQAIFMSEESAKNMRRALINEKVERLMLIGTSVNMIKKICAALYLSTPVEIIYIDQVASKKEQNEAKQIRKTLGVHTIPVTSMEIKREFNGFYIYPIKIWLSRFGSDEDFDIDAERTIVRPTFSSLGSNVISDEALESLVRLALEDVEGLAEVLDIYIESASYGAVINLDISVYYAYNAQTLMSNIQDILSKRVERYTSINILGVNISCSRVVQRKDK